MAEIIDMYVLGFVIFLVLEALNMGYNDFEDSPLQVALTAILWPIQAIGLIGKLIQKILNG